MLLTTPGHLGEVHIRSLGPRYHQEGIQDTVLVTPSYFIRSLYNHSQRLFLCIFPCAHLSRPSPISSLWLPVQGSTSWPFVVSKGLHQGGFSSPLSSSVCRYKNSSGRDCDSPWTSQSLSTTMVGEQLQITSQIRQTCEDKCYTKVHPDIIPWKNKKLLSQRGILWNIPARQSVITTDASLMGGEQFGKAGLSEVSGASLDLRPHQCAGAQGSLPLSEVFSTVIAEQTCLGKDRLYVCSVLHQTPGWHQISIMSPCDKETTFLVISESPVSQSSVHTWSSKQSRRPAVLNWTSSGRVTSPSSSGKTCGKDKVETV